MENRVDPYGAIFASPARGTFMGNRGGVLHNDDRQIVRPFKSQRWITCLLQFKGRHRIVMSPGHYTELFFLDEAVAFAAGHRPCAECRRDRFTAFQYAWQSGGLRAPEIDAALHRARLTPAGQKLTYQAPVNNLPDGTFIEVDAEPYLVWNDALFLWGPDRYTRKLPRPASITVTVLTPKSIVQCFRRGYRPATAIP